MSYLSGVLTIRGKSYDPKPYGNLSSIHVWIKNDADTIVFEDWRNNTEMYYEGEYTTGEQALLGRGGALYYMPEEFERDIIWASNGIFTGDMMSLTHGTKVLVLCSSPVMVVRMSGLTMPPVSQGIVIW